MEKGKVIEDELLEKEFSRVMMEKHRIPNTTDMRYDSKYSEGVYINRWRNWRGVINHMQNCASKYDCRALFDELLVKFDTKKGNTEKRKKIRKPTEKHKMITKHLLIKEKEVISVSTGAMLLNNTPNAMRSFCSQDSRYERVGKNKYRSLVVVRKLKITKPIIEKNIRDVNKIVLHMTKEGMYNIYYVSAAELIKRNIGVTDSLLKKMKDIFAYSNESGTRYKLTEEGKELGKLLIEKQYVIPQKNRGVTINPIPQPVSSDPTISVRWGNKTKKHRLPITLQYMKEKGTNRITQEKFSILHKIKISTARNMLYKWKEFAAVKKEPGVFETKWLPEPSTYPKRKWSTPTPITKNDVDLIGGLELHMINQQMIRIDPQEASMIWGIPSKESCFKLSNSSSFRLGSAKASFEPISIRYKHIKKRKELTEAIIYKMKVKNISCMGYHDIIPLMDRMSWKGGNNNIHSAFGFINGNTAFRFLKGVDKNKFEVQNPDKIRMDSTIGKVIINDFVVKSVLPQNNITQSKPVVVVNQPKQQPEQKPQSQFKPLEDKKSIIKSPKEEVTKGDNNKMDTKLCPTKTTEIKEPISGTISKKVKIVEIRFCGMIQEISIPPNTEINLKIKN